MAEIAENQEKVFEYFNKLEPKLRMEIIDEMQPDDRCRMTRCSKQCNEEVKASKNYVYELNLVCTSNYMRVEFNPREFGIQGFRMMFVERDGKKLKIYATLLSRELWNDELESSADLYQCAVEEFKNLLQKYQNTVKIIFLYKSPDFNNDGLEPIDYEIGILKSLEKLGVHGHFNILQLLSKLRHPLKSLAVSGEEDSELLANCKQICEVKSYIHWLYPDLNNQQFQRLSTEHLITYIGKLTERDIFNFIRSWQNGTIGREVRSYSWRFSGSNFDKTKLLRLLRVADSTNGMIKIQHFNEPEKRATFHHNDYSVVFWTEI